MDIGYLKLVSPEGMVSGFCHISWFLIGKLEAYWRETGINQYDALLWIMSVVVQGSSSDRLWVPDES